MNAHKNNIGLLRLVFAGLVIIGHSFFMVDRNVSHDPLHAFSQSLLLAEVGVDAFFLLSGYLITRSLVRTGDFRTFIERRVLRIYPAFLVAYVLSVFVLGPVLGAKPWLYLPATLFRMVTLQDPMVYPEMPKGNLLFPSLNASMWTISYEFRCYLLTAALGALGLLRRRAFILGMAMVGLVGMVLTTYPFTQGALQTLDTVRALIGHPVAAVKFTTIFLIGTCAFLFEEEIRPHLSGLVALAFTIATAVLTYRNPHLAEAALVSLGAVSLFWLALKANLGPFQTINDGWDISYGVYLYGWPVGIYLLHIDPDTSRWGHSALTLLFSALLGAASWWGCEKWTKDWVRSRSRRPETPVNNEPANVGAS